MALVLYPIVQLWVLTLGPKKVEIISDELGFEVKPLLFPCLIKALELEQSLPSPNGHNRKTQGVASNRKGHNLVWNGVQVRRTRLLLNRCNDPYLIVLAV